MRQVDISAVGVTSFEGPEGKFDVEVFDPADDYVKLMKWVVPQFKSMILESAPSMVYVQFLWSF